MSAVTRKRSALCAIDIGKDDTLTRAPEAKGDCRTPRHTAGALRLLGVCGTPVSPRELPLHQQPQDDAEFQHEVRGGELKRNCGRSHAPAPLQHMSRTRMRRRGRSRPGSSAIGCRTAGAPSRPSSPVLRGYPSPTRTPSRAPRRQQRGLSNNRVARAVGCAVDKISVRSAGWTPWIVSDWACTSR